MGTDESENCANCGRRLGAIEIAMMYQNRRVCRECYHRLTDPINSTGGSAWYKRALDQPGEGYAIASLVCGIVAYLVVPLLGALLAVIFGHLSRAQSKAAGAATPGMAIVGLVLGWVQLAGVALILLLLVVVCLFGLVITSMH